MSLDSVLATIKEFGALIGTGFLLAVGGVLYRVLRATIHQKEAQIEVLRERVKAAEALSFKRVDDEIGALVHIREWRQNSEVFARVLESMGAREDDEHKARIERELAERTRIAEEHEAQRELSSIERFPQSAEAFCGTYSVMGRICEGSANSYEGILEVRSKGEGVVSARWVIGPTKTEYSGYGVFAGGRLAIAYKFKIGGHRVSGVALYELVSPEVLRGVWAQPSSTYLGIEECRRLGPDELDSIASGFLRNRHQDSSEIPRERGGASGSTLHS